MKLEQRFIADEKSVVYKRTGIKGLLYRTLPTGAYDYLRGARLKLASSPLGARLSLARAAAYDAMAQSGVLSGLYYAIGSRTYDREHRATLTARAKYLRDVYTGDGNVFVLRRNIHKLEKALVMKPRRAVFALAYLRETVVSYADCVARMQAGELADCDTLEWSRQVLRVYFAAIQKSHPIVEESRAIFEAAAGKLPATGDQPRVPFARTAAELPSYESILKLAQQRRSVRWFDGRPVPRELIDRAVTVAGLSPSACNRQPFRFAIFDEPELCQKVAAIPKGTPGWVHNIPCFLVIVGTLAAFDREKDRHIPYIDGALAAMALCFALESQGVSSCCVNWPDLADTEARMAQTLGLAPWERPIMCMAIGYPDMNEHVPYSQKLPLDELRSYNRVGK
ncbi:MAG TPA: nitroreductase family protein [Kofleriaceae bacterium]|jgi:nitroreductase